MRAVSAYVSGRTGAVGIGNPMSWSYTDFAGVLLARWEKKHSV